MFTELLDAAQLSPDKLVRELGRQGQPAVIRRATLYDWRDGQHLPGDETAFKAVVRMCLQHARQRGARPPVADEAGWMSLLQEARQSRASERGARVRSGRGEFQRSAGRAAGDWDPVVLGVHKAVGGDPLPTFVRRPHDDLLDAALDPGTPGSRLIVLRGGPSTGKSRSAYNAVCAGPLAPWRLEYPPIPAELTRLLEEAVRPRTVIWLRELRDYADAEGGQDALARLARVLSGNGPVIAVATTWEPFWGAYTGDHRGDAGSRNPYLAARALLAGLPELASVTGVNPARGGVIDVPEEFSDSELSQARELSDPALAEAITAAAREHKPRRVIQYLAGVPDLLHHYEGPGADPYARAVITTAMDVARVTGLQRCTPAFLRRAASGYLADEQRVIAPDDWCDTAIKVATTELRGAVRALTPVPHRQGTDVASYQLADYLDQHGRKIFAAHIPPTALWAAATQSDPAVQRKFGEAAANRGLLKTGAQLLKNATEADARAGAQMLGIMHPLHPDDTRPAAWVAEHADLTDPGSVSFLLNAMRKAGADAELAALIQRDPASHVDMSDLADVSFLMQSLHQAGAGAQVTALLAREPVSCADTADSGIFFLLPALRDIGATDQLATLAGRAVADEDMIYPAYTAALLDALRDVRAVEQIATLVARNPAAHVDMSEPLFDVIDLITALHKVGADEQVSALAKRAAAAANPDEIVSLSALLVALHDAGRDRLVSDLLRNGLAARVDITDTYEVSTLLEALAACGADTEVAALLARDPATYADLTSPSNVAELLTVLREIGANAQAASLLARDPLAHVDQGDPGAILTDLLPVLEDQEANTMIAALTERLPAVGYFAPFLRYSERAEDYRFGRDHDGRSAAPWGWDDLE